MSHAKSRPSLLLMIVLLAAGLAAGFFLFRGAEAIAQEAPAIADPHPVPTAELAAVFDAAPAPAATPMVLVPAEASPVPTADDPDGILLAAYKAIVDHDWWALVAVVLVGLVWLSRQPWALGRVPWFLTDRGGAVLALGVAFVGMLSHAIAATGGPPTLAALWAAAKISGLGVGLYTLVKKLIAPADVPG